MFREKSDYKKAREALFAAMETLEKNIPNKLECDDEYPQKTRGVRYKELCEQNGFQALLHERCSGDGMYHCIRGDCDKCKEYWNEVISYES